MKIFLPLILLILLHTTLAQAEFTMQVQPRVSGFGSYRWSKFSLAQNKEAFYSGVGYGASLELKIALSREMLLAFSEKNAFGLLFSWETGKLNNSINSHLGSEYWKFQQYMLSPRLYMSSFFIGAGIGVHRATIEYQSKDLNTSSLFNGFTTRIESGVELPFLGFINLIPLIHTEWIKVKNTSNGEARDGQSIGVSTRLVISF